VVLVLGVAQGKAQAGEEEEQGRDAAEEKGRRLR
jgi:hypothetical protein